MAARLTNSSNSWILERMRVTLNRRRGIDFRALFLAATRYSRFFRRRLKSAPKTQLGSLAMKFREGVRRKELVYLTRGGRLALFYGGPGMFGTVQEGSPDRLPWRIG